MNKIYIIAEMACSHDGNVQLAKTIIDGAGRAGADAIQLQIWSLIHVMAPSHEVFEVCKKIEFNQQQWQEIVQYSRKHFPKMEIICCVYEHKSIDFIDSLGIDGYKLNSSDLSNPYVLDSVARKGKKINLSIGASTLSEIQSAIERIRKISQAPITLMYGYQNFPTAVQDIHLNYMAKMSHLFELPVGYQDHCDAETQEGFWIPALAVGMGAQVIEKHITHDRSLKGVDYQSALNPGEFGQFVRMMRSLEDAKGLATPKSFSADELKYRKFQKKSIVAARPIKAGETITVNDINFLRADQLGVPPDQADSIIGRVAKKELSTYQNISKDDVS